MQVDHVIDLTPDWALQAERYIQAEHYTSQQGFIRPLVYRLESDTSNVETAPGLHVLRHTNNSYSQVTLRSSSLKTPPEAHGLKSR